MYVTGPPCACRDIGIDCPENHFFHLCPGAYGSSVRAEGYIAEHDSKQYHNNSNNTRITRSSDNNNYCCCYYYYYSYYSYYYYYHYIDCTTTTIFNWRLCERAQHLAGDCRDVHSLWCETGSVIYSWLKVKKS